MRTWVHVSCSQPRELQVGRLLIGWSGEMTVFCRCNGGGKCKNCVCAKANRRCMNCLPFKRGCCSNTTQNTAQTALAQSQDVPVCIDMNTGAPRHYPSFLSSQQPREPVIHPSACGIAVCRTCWLKQSWQRLLYYSNKHPLLACSNTVGNSYVCLGAA